MSAPTAVICAMIANLATWSNSRSVATYAMVMLEAGRVTPGAPEAYSFNCAT